MWFLKGGVEREQAPGLGVTVLWPWAHFLICTVLLYLQPKTVVNLSEKMCVECFNSEALH